MQIKWAAALWLMGSTASLAQQFTPARFEVAATYTYVHTNAPPGGCGCFSLNGFSGSGAYHLAHHVAIAGDVAVAHNGNVDGTNTALTLTSYTFGPRYVATRKDRAHMSVSPFAQALVGGAYKSASTGGASAFAMNLGGGVDLDLNRRWSIRLVEADYYLTCFPNDVNSRQNNLRLSAGAVYRF